MSKAPRQAAHPVSAAPIGSSAPDRVPLVLRNIADVERLLNWTRAARRLPRGELVVALPGLDERTRDAFQTALNKSIRACGCAAGGTAFLIAGASLAVYALAVSGNSAWLDLVGIVGVGLIAVIVVTIIAKLLGLHAARLRFRRSCERLVRLVSNKRSVAPVEGGTSNDMQAMG
jgi:hypothetical protein